MKFWLCLFLLLPALAHAVPGDDRFLAAREAFRTGDRVHLAGEYNGITATTAHDLDPWIEYWYLRQRLDDHDSSGIADFLQRQGGSYLAERLRGDWLRSLGKQRQWERYPAEFSQLKQADTELTCYALQARLLSASPRDASSATLDEARLLWFSVLDMPEGCRPLMDRLVAAARIDVDDVWERMRRLLENKRYNSARSLAEYLPGTQPPALKLLESIADKPQRYLDKQLPVQFYSSRAGRELALFALQRLARSEPAQAATRLQKWQHRLPEDERSYAWGQIAWQAALRHQPEALGWYALATQGKEIRLNDAQRAWQVRAALRAHDWSRVQQAIGQMPATLLAQPDWIYWRGRALAEQGRNEEAHALYAKIAGQPSFYGNLADEELGRRIVPPPRAQPPSSEEQAAASSNPGLRRALALFRLNMRLEGVREWNWALREMNDRQLLAAADLAQRSAVFDRAIYAAERTQTQHDYALRYLAPFRDNVIPQARQVALDSGWVYGLMRQESRFVMNAQSGVGAKGLMQLMPKTAAWVAKKIGMTHFHPADVTLMDTNVALGTHYLRMVLADLDNHPVLASAAYNAGPGRARRWRAEQALEGAIYAETIPFDETRDYVKKVMSNAVYYTALFENQPQSLKARLGVVGPRSSGTPAADLP
ncbi:MAG: lytic transglycosylase domain-containing protein [Sterolibacterium sp.]|jgi:soluble lytic murein transglycosylase|nr:lytic transglycosylase domain-containing protein [Sterolibacterium sp.]